MQAFRLRALLPASMLALSVLTACGGDQTAMDEGTSEPDATGSSESDASAGAPRCSAQQWWNASFTYVHMVGGWWDTDLAVSSSTPVQLRHASKLVAEGVYGWGWMPTFRDLVTGQEFRFLHLRPQHRWTRTVGKTYPAGTLVGVSGGDTWDTGGAGRGYSTGPHLCVQTLPHFRTVFPAGHDRCN